MVLPILGGTFQGVPQRIPSHASSFTSWAFEADDLLHRFQIVVDYLLQQVSYLLMEINNEIFVQILNVLVECLAGMSYLLSMSCNH